MTSPTSDFARAMKLYRTTQAGMLQFWVSKPKKERAERQLGALLRKSPELPRQLEECALQKGYSALWSMIESAQKNKCDAALYARAIDCKYRSICDAGCACLMARLKAQSKLLSVPSEADMPLLNESRDALAGATGPTQMLLMAIDNAVHRQETAFHFLCLLHELSYNEHVWGGRPYDDRVGKPIGPLSQGAIQLSIAVLGGKFGEQIAERYTDRWNTYSFLMDKKITREQAIAFLSAKLEQ